MCWVEAYTPLGAVDAVGPGLFHQRGQHLGLLYLQAAGDVLHGAHPVEHGEIRPAFLFDVPDDFHRKPRPVLDGAAVLVAALVGKGQGESPHQVAVGPWTSTPSKPACLGRRAQSPNCSTSWWISSTVSSRGVSGMEGSRMGEGPTGLSPVMALLVSRPAW